MLETVETKIRSGEVLSAADLGPITVARYAKGWSERRKIAGVADWKNDKARLRLHALPMIGRLKLREVRARHLKDLFLSLRTTTELAPSTIRNVYGVLAALFREAAVDDLIDRNPCILTKAELG